MFKEYSSSFQADFLEKTIERDEMKTGIQQGANLEQVRGGRKESG